MTKINWKVRAKNVQFWITIALAIFAPLFAYYGISGADLTTWQSVGHLIKDAVSNPYVLVIIAVSVYNAILDPTTAGIADSKRALSYKKPNKDGGK